MRAAVDNAADGTQVREAQRKERVADRQDVADLAELGEIPAFARFLYRRVTHLNVYHTTFSSDPLLMAFNEGQRNVGLQLLADLERANPTALIDLMRARIKENG